MSEIMESTTKGFFGAVRWCTEDILHEAKERGIKISKKEAEMIGDMIEDTIQAAMITTGWDVIGNELASFAIERAKGGFKND